MIASSIKLTVAIALPTVLVYDLFINCPCLRAEDNREASLDEYD